MSAIKRHLENEAERLGVTVDHLIEVNQFFHPTPDEDVPPSCFTCKHVKTWSHPATREDPEDAGWECNHPDQALINENWIEPTDDGFDDEKLAAYCAQYCPAYEFFDWDAQRIKEENDLAKELEAQKVYAQVYKMFGVIE